MLPGRGGDGLHADRGGTEGIAWHEWGAEAFERARREGKPVLLDISATWCHWCHVMDDVTYSDPEVVRKINRHFVPVRVDTDRRPDVNARYNMGGWPTTAFLTPSGDILFGTTFVPPETMSKVLDQVARACAARPEELTAGLAEEPVADLPGALTTDQPQEPSEEALRGADRPDRDREPPPTALERGKALAVVGDTLKAAVSAYDPEYGGFGREPKFPLVPALDLLLTAHLRSGEDRYLDIVARTVRAMREGGLHDPVAGGFFRYSTTRDWRIPHFEKMLADNAELLSLLARLARLTGEESYLETALRTAGYLERWLRQEEGWFAGSQDADDAYYRLDEAGRSTREPPRVDRTLYTGWNALAARAFLQAHLTVADPRLREVALVALEWVWGAARRPDGSIAHYVEDGASGGPVLLADAAEVALALLDAHEATGEAEHLDRARSVLRGLEQTFGDDRPQAGKGSDRPQGDERAKALYDVAGEGERTGLLRHRYRDLVASSRAALALLRLADMTRDGEESSWARRAAEGALAGLEGAARRSGLLGADYSLALDWWLGPTVVVETSDEPLRFTAASAVAGARVVRSVVDVPPGQALVCVEGRCLAPIARPAELLRVIRKAAERTPSASG
ncbi:MAG: DUF255 domain-containing protein [Firmicutes bacterium]|nr:DUF255 domain-containing protein [Bacillota bacterium]